jgi:co-chaperonin GroES (HSP10)
MKGRNMAELEVVDKRSSSGYETPEVEIHGKVEGFQPAGDYVLIRRNKAVEQDGMIVRPEVAVELAERGVVISTSQKAFEVPVGAIAKFSKYGAEEIHFDNEGLARYALVRTSDIRGWHYKGNSQDESVRLAQLLEMQNARG